MGGREEEEEGAVRASGSGTEPQGGGRALGSGSEPQRTGQSHRERDRATGSRSEPQRTGQSHREWVRATENGTEPRRTGQSHGAGQSQGKGGVRATEQTEVIGKRVRNRRTQAPLCLQLGPCCWPRSPVSRERGGEARQCDAVDWWKRGNSRAALAL